MIANVPLAHKPVCARQISNAAHNPLPWPHLRIAWAPSCIRAAWAIGGNVAPLILWEVEPCGGLLVIRQARGSSFWAVVMKMGNPTTFEQRLGAPKVDQIILHGSNSSTDLLWDHPPHNLLAMAASVWRGSSKGPLDSKKSMTAKHGNNNQM